MTHVKLGTTDFVWPFLQRDCFQSPPSKHLGTFGSAFSRTFALYFVDTTQGPKKLLLHTALRSNSIRDPTRDDARKREVVRMCRIDTHLSSTRNPISYFPEPNKESCLRVWEHLQTKAGLSVPAAGAQRSPKSMQAPFSHHMTIPKPEDIAAVCILVAGADQSAHVCKHLCSRGRTLRKHNEMQVHPLSLQDHIEAQASDASFPPVCP
jgi:hypothetical protein